MAAAEEGKKGRRGTILELPPEERPEESGDYKAPPKESIEQILSKDEGDESLAAYKRSLLGDNAATGSGVAKFPDDERHVVVESVSIVPEGRPAIVLDIENPQPYVLKEGCDYHLEIKFYVQHDVVMGLKFLNNVYRMKVRVDKDTTMIGSFAPKLEPVEFQFAHETAPSGFAARGSYTATARLVDDDGFVHFSMDYAFAIKKEWE